MKLLKKRPIVLSVLGLVVILAFWATAEGQTSMFGGIETYDSAEQWVLVTDQTGTWHAPMAFHSSAAPSNSITEFALNTDNQFEIQTFNKGNLASLLDLDTDGSAALYGAGGGGIGVEAATGDTCIPTVQAAPCSQQALRIGANGVLRQYLGQTTAGSGISAILYSTDATLTGSFGPYTIFTTNPSGYAAGGMYRITGYMTATAAATGGSMQFLANYSDETGAQTQSTGLPIAFGNAGNKLPFSFVFYSQPGKPITITIVTTGGPTYTIHLRLEAL